MALTAANIVADQVRDSGVNKPYIHMSPTSPAMRPSGTMPGMANLQPQKRLYILTVAAQRGDVIAVATYTEIAADAYEARETCMKLWREEYEPQGYLLRAEKTVAVQDQAVRDAYGYL